MVLSATERGLRETGTELESGADKLRLRQAGLTVRWNSRSCCGPRWLTCGAAAEGATGPSSAPARSVSLQPSRVLRATAIHDLNQLRTSTTLCTPTANEAAGMRCQTVGSQRAETHTLPGYRATAPQSQMLAAAPSFTETCVLATKASFSPFGHMPTAWRRPPASAPPPFIARPTKLRARSATLRVRHLRRPSLPC